MKNHDNAAKTQAHQRAAEHRRERARANTERAETLRLIAEAIGTATTVEQAVENLFTAANAYAYAD